MTRSSKLVKIHSTRLQYTVYSKEKTMMRKKSCMPNGNMIKDRNKGISNIRYNHLNLPTEIKFERTNNKITYLYSESFRDRGSEIPRDTIARERGHSYNTGFSNVSRFAQGTNARMIKGYVDQAVKHGTPIKGGFEYN